MHQGFQPRDPLNLLALKAALPLINFFPCLSRITYFPKKRCLFSRHDFPKINSRTHVTSRINITLCLLFRQALEPVISRKGHTMIDFVYRLNNMMPNWPAGNKLSLQQLSQNTETSIPHLIQYLTDGLGKDIDIAAMLTAEEAKEALHNLSNRIRPQLEARERAIAEKRAKTISSYNRIMGKVRVQLTNKSWHTAFRTLSYFAGENRDFLPDDYLTTLCSDIVRIGIKANENIQELGRWLEMGIAVALHRHTKDGIEEALDLIDAYGENFLSEDTGKGALILGNLLAALEEPAARFELWEEYKALINQLYPIDVTL